MADPACGEEEEKEGKEIMNATDELELVKSGAKRLGEYPERLDRLEKLIGQPADEGTKPLFDIVVALNREVLDLRLKLEGMEDSNAKK